MSDTTPQSEPREDEHEPATGEAPVVGESPDAQPEQAAELSPLESLRQDVAARLETVIEVEAEVRESVDRLNTRLQPMLKKFKQLEPVMNLSEPAIAKALETALSQVDGQVESIERLRKSVAREVHFRDQLADATLSRWQMWRKLNADPAEAWSQRIAGKQKSNESWATEFDSRVQTHERRWLPQVTPETGLVQQIEEEASVIQDTSEIADEPQPSDSVPHDDDTAETYALLDGEASGRPGEPQPEMTKETVESSEPVKDEQAVSPAEDTLNGEGADESETTPPESPDIK